MKQDPFERYMLNKKKNIQANNVQLQLSESSGDQKKPVKHVKQRQIKIDQLFSKRAKNKNQIIDSTANANTLKFTTLIEQPQQYRWNRPSQKKNEDAKKRFSQATKQFHINMKKTQQNLKQTTKQYNQYKGNSVEVPIYQANMTKTPLIVTRNQQIQQQRKLKRQQKRQQQKKKQEQAKKQAIKRKQLTFKNFLNNITQKNIQNTKNSNNQEERNELHNIAMFNKIQEQNMQKMGTEDKKIGSNKNGNGLIYKKITVQRQKIPTSFLKLLLSFKFSSQIVTQETKKVPNSFQDQLTYKKTFHYLVANQCIADIQIRLRKIQQQCPQGLPIVIGSFKPNSDGFVCFSMNQQIKQSNKPSGNEKQKQKYMLKNMSLSRNRLALVTNAKNFKLDHYGIPSSKNERIFSFLCILVTPQSKQQLNSETKAITILAIQNLDIILKLNKTNKCFLYDLQKISTHLRQYLAISNLYDTQVASFIYNPSLIQSHYLDMIPQEQRQMLQPILGKLKNQYNATQYQSIRQMVLRQSGIVLLQGPPGTGKTTTLMGLLAAQYEYLKNICGTQDKRKILICAPSNAAINHITKRIKCEGLISTNLNYSHFSNESIVSKQYVQHDRIYPNILRVGIVETDDPDIISVSLDDICDKQMLKVKKSQQKRNNLTTTEIKQQMYTISKQINKIKSRKDLQQWDIEGRVQNLKYQIKKYETLLFNFRKQRVQLKQAYNQIQNKLFQEADIILTTLSSSGSQKMQRLRGFIGCLIIDEAAQSTQPSILIPLQTGVRKVLLVGDPFQLPSTTMSQDSSITLFNRSLFQRFIDNGVKPYFLNIQYRMAPMIRQFPSATFYQNRLVDAESVLQRYKMIETDSNSSQGHKYEDPQLNSICQFFGRNSIFLDIKFGTQQFHSNSYRNIGECLMIKTLILNFLKRTNLSIGVITPYQAQKKYLMKQLKKQIQTQKQRQNQSKSLYEQNKSKSSNCKAIQANGEQTHKQMMQQGQILHQDKNQNNNNQPQSMQQSRIKKQPSEKDIQQQLSYRLMINTVDSFQGQQKDIIIVSTVRSNSKNDIGFMKDQRRINVALTRSKHILIVVGNGDTIGSNQIWNKYLDWSEKQRCYYQVNQRQSIKTTFYHINDTFNNKNITRKRHSKLSRDIRKIERQQIRRQDFGLGKSTKRVKVDKTKNITQKVQKQLLNLQIMNQEVVIQKNNQTNQIKMRDQNEAYDEKLLQQKRARQQQAINLQETNRRIKQLQQKLKLDQNNPYAQLFQ